MKSVQTDKATSKIIAIIKLSYFINTWKFVLMGFTINKPLGVCDMIHGIWFLPGTKSTIITVRGNVDKHN